MAPNTPIIVGVGEIREKEFDIQHTTEPAGLMIAAIRQAASDASLTAADIEKIDDISVVPPWSMQYPDLPGLLAEQLRSTPAFSTIGHHGGEQCALLTDEAARRIARGSSKLAIITGGEALASVAACQKAGLLPPPGWSAADPEAKAVSTNDLSFNGVTMASRHGMGLAIHVYPMYENGLRAHRKQTQTENTDESAELYAAFDKVACSHPASWRSGETPRDKTAIGEITPKNRLICSPYPLLQNAFNTVNLSAAVIVTSVEHATKLGIPQSKWVYLLSGAGTNDKETFYERNNFYSSQSLEQSIDVTIQQSGITKDDIECYDFYSCFPVVPKLACLHLGLSIAKPEKPITLLGGLTSFGGAGNNYSMHAIVEMGRQIRRGAVKNGMVVANGGVLTHHHCLILSAVPRRSSIVYPPKILQHDMEVKFAPPLEDVADGAAVLETYTVVFDRSGKPAVAHLVARLNRTGKRFVANSGDKNTLKYLVDPSVEPIGVNGVVRQKDGRNAFYIGSSTKL